MTAFQFDKCFDDKRIIRKCEAEGLAEALRLPRTLRDAEDPVVLSTLLARRNALVTLDRRIAMDHAAFIPNGHPGLLIVSHDPETPQTMTTSRGGRILAAFKQRYPDWHRLSLTNSVVEITPKSIEVWHVEEAQLFHDGFLGFTEADWSDRLTILLRQNVERSPKTGPS